MSRNTFSGEFPTISGLTSLETLDLSGNQLSGTIPPNAFETNVNLKEVYVPLYSIILRLSMCTDGG